MSSIPTFTKQDIKDHVGERSYERGADYADDGSICDTRQQDDILKGRCQGSEDEPYCVEVDFDSDGIISSDCSCPVGVACKHVAALLLCWLKKPSDFRAVEDLDVSLERRSKAELIVLINQMLEEHPDLEMLVEVPVRQAKQAASAPDYRKEAEAVFRSIGGGNGANSGIAHGLQPLKDTGDALLQEEDCAGAAAVYQGICGAIGRFYDMVQDEFDEENLLGDLATECVKSLGQCLDGLADDPARRIAALQALWEIYQCDVEQGGLEIGEGSESLLLEKTTPEERRTVAAWVRAAIPQGNKDSDRWRQRSLGGFLLDLEKDTLDDEAFLRVCREIGRRLDLITRLLDLKRLEDAVSEAGRCDDHELLRAADLLVQRRHADEAEQLIRERAEKSDLFQLLAWLKHRAEVRKDKVAVLELAVAIFRRHLRLDGYKEVRELAKEQHKWKALQPELLAHAQKESPVLLVHIYLDEDDIDKALEAVEGKLPSFEAERLRLHLAQATEKSRPRAALEIYRKHVDGVLRHQGRHHYQTACQYLTKVRDLYRQLGETEEWEREIAKLREKHRRLPALQQELTRAGLGQAPPAKAGPAPQEEMKRRGAGQNAVWVSNAGRGDSHDYVLDQVSPQGQIVP